MQWIKSAPAPGPLKGEARLPGDKSISQRAAIMAAMAAGTTKIDGYLQAEDARHTLDVLAHLGADIKEDNGTLWITGVGSDGFKEPDTPLYMGNSGTGLRLLLGAVAGHDAFVVFSGDGSLTARPMGRVIDPLRQMGALVDGRAGGDMLPLAVRGRPLTGADHVLPVASAQVKSALILAGLHAEGTTSVVEPAPSRDHTERMLPVFGVALDARPGRVQIAGPQILQAPSQFIVPRDPSSAAFLAIAALLVEGSEVVCLDVNLNPGRTGWIRVLQSMGARIEAVQTDNVGGEPIGHVTAAFSDLHGTTIEGEHMPATLDEIPILCVAAARARGTTVIRGAQELRIKETDRLEAIGAEWGNIGLDVTVLQDGLIIEGPQEVRGGRCHSRGDHRIAMALAVAGLIADRPVEIEDSGCIDVSFADFDTSMNALGAAVSWTAGD